VINFSVERALPIKISREEIAAFCQRHGIARLSLFQVVEDELSVLLQRQADLNTPWSLSKYFS